MTRDGRRARAPDSARRRPVQQRFHARKRVRARLTALARKLERNRPQLTVNRPDAGLPRIQRLQMARHDGRVSAHDRAGQGARRAELEDILERLTHDRLHHVHGRRTIERRFLITAQPGFEQRRKVVADDHAGCVIDRFEARIDFGDAPADASQTSLLADSVDVVFSNSVLEHVPRDMIERCFAEAHRILRPGGVMFHSVHCGDHYAHFDRSISPLHYLQFSDFTADEFLYRVAVQ